MTSAVGAAGFEPLSAPGYDLAASLTCGQVFHWRPLGSGWLGAVGDLPVYLEQAPSGEIWVNREATAIAADYLALDLPIDEIHASFPQDEPMQAALRFCPGLRILRQPAWECLATFITSALKQVAHIAQISHLLRERYGASVEWHGQRLYSYPTPERLAALQESDLRACGLGFRARNLLVAAQMIARGEVDLGHVASLPDEAGRAELCRLRGVGAKVANCALLFGFGRLRAFPIDVWIERALRDLYFPGRRKVTARKLRHFSETHFGPYGGYAQQYLFHHVRMTTPRRRAK